LFIALQQAQVHRKLNLYASSIAFSSWEVLPVLSFKEVSSSPHLVFSIFTILGVSLYKVVVLVLSFSKSPSLLKMEFECKSYYVFSLTSFAVLEIRSTIRN
jgi:hypothetical protein